MYLNTTYWIPRTDNFYVVDSNIITASSLIPGTGLAELMNIGY